MSQNIKAEIVNPINNAYRQKVISLGASKVKEES